MIIPDKPKNESERLQALQSYSVLDTISEEEYDHLTTIASQICGCSMSLISLVDENRQWFKSRVGLDANETPREYAFCGHAIHNPQEALIVEDARKDPRFSGNPLVTGQPHLVFYAGMPLVNESGHALGTLCVLDKTPKMLSDSQLHALKALSQQVMALLELRRSKIALEQSMRKLEQKNQDLEQFAFIAAHDLKSPLNGIATITELLMDSHAEALREDGIRMMNAIKGSSEQLSRMISGLLDYYRLDVADDVNHEWVGIRALEEQIATLFAGEKNLVIDFDVLPQRLYIHLTAVKQILVNLISNAIKYSDKNLVVVRIRIEESASFYLFEVSDNGPGIPEKYHDRLFMLFSIVAAHDKNGQKGNGIGLATVKKLVQRQSGEIEVISEQGQGLTIRFSVKK